MAQNTFVQMLFLEKKMNSQLEKWVSGVWGPKITSQLICFLRNQIHYIYMIYSESVMGIQY